MDDHAKSVLILWGPLHMAIHITLEKNAGTNMIHTEDQAIRTIIVFVQV